MDQQKWIFATNQPALWWYYYRSLISLRSIGTQPLHYTKEMFGPRSPQALVPGLTGPTFKHLPQTPQKLYPKFRKPSKTFKNPPSCPAKYSVLTFFGPSKVRTLPLDIANGRQCPPLTLLFVFFSFFLSSSSSDQVTFLPEGFVIGFRNFAQGFNSQKKMFELNKFLGDPSGVSFQVFICNEKC